MWVDYQCVTIINEDDDGGGGSNGDGDDDDDDDDVRKTIAISTGYVLSLRCLNVVVLTMSISDKLTNMLNDCFRAVHWKVRALRENTGTLNPRQLRRQQREQEQQQKQQQQRHQQQQQQQQQHQQQHEKQAQYYPADAASKPRPAVVVRPRRERMALPGACTTAWSLKRFVQKEVRELLASWQPENARRLRSQRFKARKELALKAAATDGSKTNPGTLVAGSRQAGHGSA